MAANDTEASVEDLAAEIPSATPDLVEHVLDEYGDPADDASESATPPEQSNSQQDPDAPDQDELTGKQTEILQLLLDHPEANQQTLADMLGVSNATISNRVNSLPGFDWSERAKFLDEIADQLESQPSKESTQPMSSTTEDLQAEDLSQRVDSIENRINDLTIESNGCFDNPELAHKVMHACMQSDAISEDEELRILKELLQ